MYELTGHQKKALDLHHHLSLTANAGSGKTFVLTRRYLDIALNEGVELREMAAITFTDKAAGELYQKIAESIDEKLAGANDTEERKKLERLRRQLISANISTIHSFCIDILKQYPVEAGIDANFIPIDQLKAQELIELAAQETVTRGLQDDELRDDFYQTARLLGGANNVSSSLKQMIYQRKNLEVIAEKFIEDRSEQETAEEYTRLFKDRLEHIAGPNFEKVRQSLQAVNNAAKDLGKELADDVAPLLKEVMNANTLLEAIPVLNNIYALILTSDNLLRKREYLPRKGNEYADEVAAIEGFHKQLAKTGDVEHMDDLHLELSCAGRLLLKFGRIAIDKYEQAKHDAGYLDFEDLLIFARNILANEDVRLSLSRKFKYIMVDEYQDTNILQYDIFLPILNYLRDAGNLFVVGDDKQSIYSFRDAELEVFRRTRSHISSKEGDDYLLTLPDSFRMAPPVCAFTNTVFQRLFANPDPLFNEVEHSDIICGKTSELEGGVELLISPADEDAIPDSLLVARRILELMRDTTLEVSVDWKDIAVLCRRRVDFSSLETAFAHYNIPYSIVGGRGFYQRQLVYDIFNYFSFLLTKENDSALVGILRSPFFNVPDNTIFEISLQQGASFWHKLIEYAKTHSRYKAVIGLLDENLSLAATTPVSTMLRKITSETEYLAVTGARANGKQELANYEKLVRISIQFMQTGFRNLYDFVAYLRSSIDEHEDEGQAPVLDDENSVKVMTMHQAKGLEFKAVFLYRLHSKPHRDYVQNTGVTLSKDYGLLTRVALKGDYFSSVMKPPIAGIHEIVSAQKAEAEAKRLLYVAVTRAKNYLFLCGSITKNLTPASESLLDLVARGMEMEELPETTLPLRKPLTLLRYEDGQYTNPVMDVDLTIPIRHIVDEQQPNKTADTANENEKRIDLKNIEDIPHGEFISATKLIVYRQCPLKYQLTYGFGFTPLFRDYRRRMYSKEVPARYEFNQQEDRFHLETAEDAATPPAGHAELKGSIIHALLQKELEGEEARDLASVMAEKKLANRLTARERDTFIDVLLEDHRRFLAGRPDWLTSASTVYNEIEMYAVEHDYFLYGIIDKLLLTDDTAVIVDYKTDDIAEASIKKRGGVYLPQLLFYALVVRRRFPAVKNIEVRVLFVKHPGKPFVHTVEQQEIDRLKQEIKAMVQKVRLEEYSPDSTHCKDCAFSLDGTKCVVESDALEQKP